MTWIYHGYESAQGRYDMILGRYASTESLLNLKLSEHAIESDYGPLKGYTTPMVDLGTYIFKDLNKGKIAPKKLFTNAYVK